MQEIKKTRIVITSVLKPVDDTRMFGKMAVSLAQSGKYEVHIIGYPSIRSYDDQSVVFHPLKPFKRISVSRMMASWKIAMKIIDLKPALMIISTHELLVAALLAKTFGSCKVIYDIRENYFRNIFHTKTFPFGIRHLVAVCVRLKEILCTPFIDHFILAEKGYEKELGIVSKRKTIIENKLRKPPVVKSNIRPSKDRIDLLFSGTMAETTGVFRAIEIAEALYALDHSVHLTLIGYCAHSETLKKIREQIRSKKFMTLIGGDKLVPHDDILNAIHQADFGFIAYPFHTSTKNSIPTKLYEYLGLRLPILLIDYAPWDAICKPFNAAITFGPIKFDAAELLRRMKTETFYTNDPIGVYWEDEETKLAAIVSKLVPTTL